MTKSQVTAHPADRLWRVYLCVYVLAGVSILGFFPSFSHNNGDEGTYFNLALHPWTLVGDMFEGYPPKEVMNPYAPRLFLTPFALTFALAGFTVVGARLWVFAYGIGILILLHRILRSFAPPWPAFVVPVLLSLTPTFVYFTHIARPEGLMSLVITICLWLALRRPELVCDRTWFALGLVSTAGALIHYNGVILAPAILAGTAAIDRGSVTIRRLAAFAAGGALTFAFFLAVDFIPAFETVRQLGILPVTFFSSGSPPVFSQSLWLMTTRFAGSVRRLMDGTYFEALPAIPALWIAILACVALWHGRRREVRMAAAVAVGLVIGLVLIVPNKRTEYLFYLYPPLCILACAGLMHLSRRGVRLATATMLGIALPYSVAINVRAVRWHWTNVPGNARTSAALRALVQDVGAPEQLKVMGVQEFWPAVYGTQYRTVHSLIALQDIDEMFRRIAPDVFILNDRVLYLIQASLSIQEPVEDVKGIVLAALERTGLVPKNTDQLTWDGLPVSVYVRAN